MIPCPVCLVVLDGGGGRCEAHIDWTFGRVWMGGAWPSLDQITDQVDDRLRLVSEYSGKRHAFSEMARAELAAANLPRYERGVFLGFRHFRDGLTSWPIHGYSQFAEGIVLPLLARARLFSNQQIEGIGHLFYTEPDQRGPGVELLIIEGPQR